MVGLIGDHYCPVLDDFSSAKWVKPDLTNPDFTLFLRDARCVYSYGHPYWEDVKDWGNYDEDDHPWGTIYEMELRANNDPSMSDYYCQPDSGLEYKLDLGYFVVVEMGADDTNICKVE